MSQSEEALDAAQLINNKSFFHSWIQSGRGTNFENINFDSRKILASTRILGPTKY
jgi:hypothetical protein